MCVWLAFQRDFFLSLYNYCMYGSHDLPRSFDINFENVFIQNICIYFFLSCKEWLFRHLHLPLGYHRKFKNSISHSMFYMHTAGLDPIFVQIYMDPPQGVPGVSKKFFFTNKTVEFLLYNCPQKAQTKKNFQKKKKKKNQKIKKPLFSN